MAHMVPGQPTVVYRAYVISRDRVYRPITAGSWDEGGESYLVCILYLYSRDPLYGPSSGDFHPAQCYTVSQDGLRKLCKHMAAIPTICIQLFPSRLSVKNFMWGDTWHQIYPILMAPLWPIYFSIFSIFSSKFFSILVGPHEGTSING